MHSFDEYRSIINEHLTDLLPELPAESSVLRDAMAYSLEVGGKRLRPALLLAASEFAGGNIDASLPFALAVEYIHTYSLIHDDMPAMDNDDLRRGRPTNHKVFGEAMAVLAGDGLLSTAAETVTGEPLKYGDDPTMQHRCIRAAHEIMRRGGASGMVAGQAADVTGENKEATAGLVRYIEEHKTADLIAAPVRAGLMLAGADPEMIEAFTVYAEDLGIAFQILDDILDFEGDEKTLGKSTGKDLAQDKCSYVCVHGMDAAKKELHRLTEEACAALEPYGDRAVFFTELASRLENRNR